MGLTAVVPRSQGFTLLELLLVVFLLGLVYALSGPLLEAGNAGLSIKSAARQLAAGFRKARSIAVTQHTEAGLTIDAKARTFSVTGDPRVYDLPRNVEVTMFTAQSEILSDAAASIRFFPDGSSTGGRVAVSIGEAKDMIDVDWLTGRVKLL
ncbi:MAG: GspH/FimT family pseudopilin [Rhodocyclaceae bacterium]|nr:GspH/FimT family pseudopilin [Rhodocyclaceae bacterium]